MVYLAAAIHGARDLGDIRGVAGCELSAASRHGEDSWVARRQYLACDEHWPNPVLVPLTFVGGTAMAWMFGRVRNVIPLAIGQALLGVLVGWASPMAWHHHMRVGPGYYDWR